MNLLDWIFGRESREEIKYRLELEHQFRVEESLQRAKDRQEWEDMTLRHELDREVRKEFSLYFQGVLTWGKNHIRLTDWNRRIYIIHDEETAQFKDDKMEEYRTNLWNQLKEEAKELYKIDL